MAQIDLSRYKLVSDKDGGVYQGPCYFTGEGEDRFSIFPHPSPYNGHDGSPMWYCRHRCPQCPGQPSKDGGSWGLFKDLAAKKVDTIKKVKRRHMNVPSIQDATRFAEALDQESLLYLRRRGVTKSIAIKHKLGKRRGKTITFPNIVTLDGERVSYGIKWRWLPQYQPEDESKYRLIKGSIGKSIYNYDTLEKERSAVVIVESIMDVLALASIDVPAVCSFAGGPTWGGKWGRFFNCDYIINIAERDEPKKKGNGQIFRPGEEYANRRAYLLALETDVKYKKVITVLPPKPYQDIGDAIMANFEVRNWLVKTVKENT